MTTKTYIDLQGPLSAGIDDQIGDERPEWTVVELEEDTFDEVGPVSHFDTLAAARIYARDLAFRRRLPLNDDAMEA